MKNATKHADVLKSLSRKLVREYKPAPKQPQEPLPALVRAAMSYDVPDGKAEDAMKAIEKEFVDLNELRVATDLEIQELLGQRYPKIEDRVAMITGALNNIFERENLVAWCIVPFDAKNRTPEERAEMLSRLGFSKFAYDYRAEHIPTFEAEIAALKRHRVELTAWWFPQQLDDEARGILALLKRQIARKKCHDEQRQKQQQQRRDRHAGGTPSNVGRAAEAGMRE
jgi:hypothetical protein